MDLTYNQIIFYVALGFFLLMSILSFALFLSDKKKAEAGKDRTKEKTLLGSAVFGGSCGALIGRIVAHHKTNKIYFSITIYLSFLLQIAVLVLLGIFAFAL